MKRQIVVALAGNPNSGKTTIFNQLTGARQHVGNYPGVTVERKEGLRRHGDREIRIVDLPGTYSLTAYSEEELIARNFIIEEKPDVVVHVIDASNLERNLYLTVQLMELGVPLVMALNMSDVAKSKGYRFDLKKLSHRFGAEIVETVGHKGRGIQELLDAISSTAEAKRRPGKEKGKPAAGSLSARGSIRGPPPKSGGVRYGEEVEKQIAVVQSLIERDDGIRGSYDARWLAVKLLENDGYLLERIGSVQIRNQVSRSADLIEKATGQSAETVIAAARYELIFTICQEAVHSQGQPRQSLSDRIDAVVTSRALGIPLFLVLMYLVFQLTFTLGDPPMGWIEEAFARLGESVSSWWPEGSESPLKSLLVDGVIGGVGGVIVFLPNILLLFLAIAILEDSGYMARAAFIMDRLMSKIGLHGKSFIPMLIGFGCSVPAIMATRTLENRRDRLATMLVVPLMSCGARLPIYALIIPAFFPRAWHAPMLWVIYTTGILLAVLSARLLRSTLLRGASVPFVMELPPYRMPTLRGVLIHMWERGWVYLKKAGTIILGISILLWAATSFPSLPEEESARFEMSRSQIQQAELTEEMRAEILASIDNEEAEAKLRHSFAGRFGRALEPVLQLMGFDWKIGTALVGAFAAKEVFVAQMGIVYSVGEADEESESLREKLRSSYSPLVGFCIMLFCLISAPCMATIAITRRESNSWRWALFQLGGLSVMAFVITATVFQIGRLMGIGGV
jgi:ferrous iron transport protein B